MVKILSNTDKEAIAQAINDAESKSSAELVVVVSPASDAYQSYLMLYGLIIGSVAVIALWATETMTELPLLLVIQFAFVGLFSYLPWLGHLLVWLVPKRVLHYHAARRAYEEYLMVTQHVSAQTPIVLLYVSIAEHYAHILTSRSVREQIPEKNWNVIVDELTTTISLEGLKNACINAIVRSTQLLTHYFPEKGEVHHLANTVIEIDK